MMSYLSKDAKWTSDVNGLACLIDDFTKRFSVKYRIVYQDGTNILFDISIVAIVSDNMVGNKLTSKKGIKNKKPIFKKYHNSFRLSH